MFKNIITWLFCFLIILGLQKIKEYIVNKNNKLTIYDYSIRKIKKLCKHKNLKEIETNFIIDFVKNPNNLSKVEIAEKYNYEEKYIYKKADALINKIGLKRSVI